MSYRKFQADHLFTGKEWLNSDHALITGTDGQVKEIIPAAGAGADIEKLTGILSPGFINCHCHLELSHMKGLIPEQTGLVDFVFKVVTERHHPETEILDAIALAEQEMMENGIVATGDICNNALTIAQKQQQHLAYYNFIEASGWLPPVAANRFERALDLYRKLSNASVVPHAPYSVSEDLWHLIQPYFENRVVTIHNQETTFEDEFFVQGTGDFTRMYDIMRIDNSHHRPTGISSLQSYFGKLSKAKKVLLVHNTFISQADLDFVKQETTNQQSRVPRDRPETYFCLCVNANRYIENALPPVELLRQNECTIVLGTDSLASNWSLSILDEIKTIRQNFPSIPIPELLQWATFNGARALDMDGKLGNFEPGKRPGVLIIKEDLTAVKRLL